MFIAIEGPDGVGKNTQTKLLAAKLESLNQKVVLFSFPRYETRVGGMIKKFLSGSFEGKWTTEDGAYILQCLNTADKFEAVGAIKSALRQGEIVICDRWWHSSYAYGCADGLPAHWLLELAEGLIQADFNFLLSAGVEDAASRIKLRGRPTDLYEKDLPKQLTVRGHYQDLWTSRRNSSGWHVIDGTGPAGDVHVRIWDIIRTRRGAFDA